MSVQDPWEALRDALTDVAHRMAREGLEHETRVPLGTAGGAGSQLVWTKRTPEQAWEIRVAYPQDAVSPLGDGIKTLQNHTLLHVVDAVEALWAEARKLHVADKAKALMALTRLRVTVDRMDPDGRTQETR